MTLAESLNLDGHHRSRYNTVRHHAREWAKKNLPNKCQICGYSKTFQVCHLRDISSYPLTTLVKVVNDPGNIIVLCPNHHWELDHEML
jgi:predicted restriction endonuclease